MTGSIGTSFAPYAKQHQPLYRIGVPTVVQQFPGELLPARRPVAERLFADIRSWRAADASRLGRGSARPSSRPVCGRQSPSREGQEMGAGASSATSCPTGRGRPYR